MANTQVDPSDLTEQETPFRVDFTFFFKEPWIIAPQKSGMAEKHEKSNPGSPDGGGMVPPGGGVHEKRVVRIGPVHLDGLSPERAIEAVRRRAENMTLLADAMAVANTEYSHALAQYSSGRPPPGEG